MPTNRGTYASAKGRASSGGRGGVRVTTQVDGLRELEEALRSLPIELVGGGSLGKNPIRKASQMVVKTMLLPFVKNAVPKDSGALKDAIVMRLTNVKSRNAALKGGNSFEAYVVGIENQYNTKRKGVGMHKGKGGTPINAYAYSLHYGPERYPAAAKWHKRARKFISGPFYANREKMEALFKVEMGLAIDRIRKKYERKSPKK